MPQRQDAPSDAGFAASRSYSQAKQNWRRALTKKGLVSVLVIKQTVSPSVIAQPVMTVTASTVVPTSLASFIGNPPSFPLPRRANDGDGL